MFFLAASLILTPVVVSAGKWIKAENVDCLLWHPSPEEGQKVRWGGKCKDGKANGDGVIEWFILQRPAERCECSVIAGKVEGEGIYRWPDGVVYVGQFKSSIIEGQGFIRYPDNEMYEGEFKNGYPHGLGIQLLPDNTRNTGKFRAGAFIGPK